MEILVGSIVNYSFHCWLAEENLQLVGRLPMRRVMTFSFKLSFFSFNRLSSKFDFLIDSRSERICFASFIFRYLRLVIDLCKALQPHLQGEISALQIICPCGSGWLCPHHVLQLTVTLSFFVTDKSFLWGGSFWSISLSPIKRNSILFMYPCAVLLSHFLRCFPYWRARSYDCLGTLRLR